MAKTITTFCTCLIILLPHLTNADWTQISSPQGEHGGVVTALLVQGDSILCTVKDKGIYRSDDHGMSWKSSDSGISSPPSFAGLVRHGSIIFGGLSSDPQSTAIGLYRSSNYGLTWSPCSLSISVNTVLVKGDTVFAGTTTGIYCSTDSGTNWTATNSGLPVNARIYSLAKSGPNLLAGTSRGIYLSANQGTYWIHKDIVQSNIDTIFTIISIENDVLVSTNNGLYRSNDYGNTWGTSTTGISPTQRITAFALCGLMIFASSQDGSLFCCSKSATTWTKVAVELAGTASILTVFADQAKLYVGTDGAGILETHDNGISWTHASYGLPSRTRIFSFHSTNTDLMIATGTGVYVSWTNGNNWTPVNKGLPENYQVSQFAAQGNAVFLATQSNGIYKLSLNQSAWIEINNGLTNKSVNAIFANNDLLFAGTNNGIFVSKDSGNIWSPINEGLADSTTIALTAGNGWVYALMRWSYGSKLYATVDNGQHWGPRDSFLFGGTGSVQVISIAAINADLLISTYRVGRFAYYGLGVSKSMDNGITLVPINTGFSSNCWVYDFTVHGADVYIGTGSGVFVANYINYNWSPVNTGLPLPPTYSYDQFPSFIKNITATDSNVFACTDSGTIWRLPLSASAIIKRASNPSNDLSPKIFSPQKGKSNLTVSLSLVRPEDVAISLSSLSGRRVASFANTNLCPGTHTLSMDIRNISQGCYIMKIQIGTNMYTKNATILK